MWEARLERIECSNRLERPLALQLFMVKPLIRGLPRSHHSVREEKERRRDCQVDQKSEIRLKYSTSSRIAVLSFQRPGPGGEAEERVQPKERAEWSEKGQGRISATDTYGIQR